MRCTTFGSARSLAHSIGSANSFCRLDANLISEILGTLILVFVVGAILSKAVAASGPASGLGPYLVAALVWGIGLSLGGTTGYRINPARDFGPRLGRGVLPIAGKGASDWSYAIVPVLGPLEVGLLASFCGPSSSNDTPPTLGRTLSNHRRSASYEKLATGSRSKARQSYLVKSMDPDVEPVAQKGKVT